ncbi:MAG: BamA/TamA family outer membrane protein [Novosphingobium sp.]|nr:BamA/TamA family outer membrane protein [Novosphingobium sp.]
MASTARRSVTPTPDRRAGDAPLSRILAGLMVLALPVPCVAQSMNADQELEALIPDSAVQNPETWALDTDAARSVVPSDAQIGDLSNDVAMPELPGITIPWPDGSEIPDIAPLTPDPDIAVAEQSVDAAVEALPGQEEAEVETRLANADVERVGKQVELAFPTGADAIPERAEIAARFAALSSLKTFDDDKDNLAQIVRRGRTDTDLLIEIMRVHGYYDASVFQSIGGLERAGEGEARGPIDVEKVVVRFDIQPGPQYRFGKLAFGDLEATGKDFAALRGAFTLKPGDAVNADRIVAARADLQAALGEAGYAFAKVAEPDLVIDHERREGDLTVAVTPGGVYRFGKVTSSREGFLSGKHLQRIAKFDPGDLYQRSDVEDLRQAVLATGLVSSVSVATRESAPAANGEPGTVDVDVALTPGPLRTVAGLVGYSSGEGFRVEASWEHRSFFPPEGMVRVRGVAGTQEQLLGLTFRRNNFLTRDLVLTADLYARQQRSTAFQARTVSFLGGVERLQTLLFQKPVIYAAGVEILATSERDAAAIAANAPRQTYFIGALPMRIAFDGSDDLLDPKRGFRVGLRASPEISVQDGVRSSYGKFQLDASYYQPFGEKLVVAGRLRLGSIQGTEITNIAPSRRFYAGGGGSVRGYGFQLIGPRDTAGEPSGGRSLSEFSLEARVKTGLMGGAISLVPFVDAGAVDITSTPRLRDIKVGAGIGLRYETNFGPIRIDLGTPLNPSPGDSRIGVYVALGQAF